MILEVIKRSVTSERALIPVETLLHDASGSRMPDVDASRLTVAIAKRVVEACPTPALSLEGTELSLNYGECIACGNCIEAGEGAFIAAAKLARCGVPKSALVRRWDCENTREISGNEPELADAAQKIRAIVGKALNIRQVDD